MAKPGPKGPHVYTPERVGELAESLETYFDATASLYFETWAAIEGLHMRQVRRIVEANENFAEVYEKCECIQASRLLEGSTRPVETSSNQLRYAVNPKMATLVLQNKHGYANKNEVTMHAAEEDTQSKVRSRVETLLAAKPTDPAKARHWLDEILENAPGDQVTQQAVEHVTNLVNMTEQAQMLGSAICNE